MELYTLAGWVVASPCIFAVCIILIRLISFVIRYQLRKWEFTKLPRVPGVIPIMTMFDFENGVGRFLQQLRRPDGSYINTSLAGSMTDGFPLICAGEPDDIKVVLNETNFKKPDLFYQQFKELLGAGLVTNSGESWLKDRKLITPVFHLRGLKDMLPTMIRIANQWVREEKENKAQPHFVADMYSRLTLRVLIGCVFSDDLDWQEMADIFHETVKGLDARYATRLLLGTWLNDKLPIPHNLWARRGSYLIRSKTLALMEERRHLLETGQVSKEAHDLLWWMLKARDENGEPMPDERILDQCGTFLFAGHDTTSNMISWTTFFLSRHPDCQQKVKEEVDRVLGDDPKAELTADQVSLLTYTKWCCMEALRLVPPIPMFARQARIDTSLPSGQTIKKDTYVLPWPMLAHRNPKHWDDPEIYFPERFGSEKFKTRHPFSYLPFSAGSRNCIGQKFAMNQGTLVIATIVRHFRIVAEKDEKVGMAWQGTVIPTGFHCKFVTREGF